MQDVSVNPNGLELIQYMSNEISKDFASDHEYMIIANFVNYLLNVNMKQKILMALFIHLYQLKAAVLMWPLNLMLQIQKFALLEHHYVIF